MPDEGPDWTEMLGYFIVLFSKFYIIFYHKSNGSYTQYEWTGRTHSLSTKLYSVQISNREMTYVPSTLYDLDPTVSSCTLQSGPLQLYGFAAAAVPHLSVTAMKAEEGNSWYGGGYVTNKRSSVSSPCCSSLITNIDTQPLVSGILAGL